MPSSKSKMPPGRSDLARRSYRVIRFWNRDVIDNLPGVLVLIQQELNSRRKWHRFARRERGNWSC